jgi:hypothetical protein
MANYDVIYQNEQSLKVKFCINDADINGFIHFIKDIKVNYFKEIKYTLEDHFMNFYKEAKDFGGIE